jgi:hypothetical protein
MNPSTALGIIVEGNGRSSRRKELTLVILDLYGEHFLRLDSCTPDWDIQLLYSYLPHVDTASVGFHKSWRLMLFNSIHWKLSLEADIALLFWFLGFYGSQRFIIVCSSGLQPGVRENILRGM